MNRSSMAPNNEDIIDDYFESFPNQTIKSKSQRSSTISMALPEGLEGNWGSIDRKYVIGGNWKSNGDLDFIKSSFPNDFLNKILFNPSQLELIVAPNDNHLS